ncbi:MAG: hypothetical protein MR434_05010 [Ruminococcus sp.]|nr:hypothetical protein [Ruminococcus sp.]
MTRSLAENGHEVYLFNKGSQNSGLPLNIRFINCDINDENAAAEKLDGMTFDAVCGFIGFVRPQLERDFRLFSGKTKQFIYITLSCNYCQNMLF